MLKKSDFCGPVGSFDFMILALVPKGLDISALKSHSSE